MKPILRSLLSMLAFGVMLVSPYMESYADTVTVPKTIAKTTATTTASTTTNVVIIGDDAYPPYSYIQDGRMQGIYTDVLREVFKSMEGYKVAIYGMPWKRGLLEVKNGKAFAIYPPYHHPDTRPYMDYDLPILSEEVVAYCNKNVLQKERPNWPEDYYGLTIGNNLGFLVGGEEFYEAVKQGHINLVENSGSRKNLLNLLAGKVDCYINDYFSIQWELGKIAEKRKRRVNRSRFAKGAIISSEQGYLGFSVNSESFPFKADFKRQYLVSLKKIKETNLIEDIIEQHVTLHLEEKNTAYYSVTSVSWPPYWIVTDRQISGILSDIMKELDQRTGIRLVPSQPMPVKRAKRLFQLGDSQIECCVNEQWRSSLADDKLSLWSEPVLEVEEVIVSNKKYKGELTSLNDLQGETVATVLGYGYVGEENFKRDDSPDNIAQLRKVGIGSAKFGIIDANELAYTIKNSDKIKKMQREINVGPVINKSELKMRIHTSRPELIGPINRAIVEMRRDGVIDRIVRSYIE